MNIKPVAERIKREFSVTNKIRDGSSAAATSKMERFVIIVNGFQPLTIITRRSILDFAAVLDPPLKIHGASILFAKLKTKLEENHENHWGEKPIIHTVREIFPNSKTWKKFRSWQNLYFPL